MAVPFFRPSITRAEIDDVVHCLESGWLTTGPRTKQFEEEFAARVGAKHALALNSCTAALHLALEAVGVQRGDTVVVPTMTFAATAEVVRYFDATPVLVDCDPVTQCIDVVKLRETCAALKAGKPVAGLKPPYGPLKALIPMHYGGQMADVDGVAQVAKEFGVPVIEDAAHTLPAYTRSHAQAPWRQVGSTADITCFSFYANKCITTGEGGMAVTQREDYAERMRVMSLHGMSKDAWKRFTNQGSWYYELVAPGFKYNLTDIASAIGLQQLKRADALWAERKQLAERYRQKLQGFKGLELPVELADRQHSWHLFSVRVVPSAWSIDRAKLIDELKALSITCSVHWMPLHLHPYYRKTYGYGEGLFPVAESIWPRLISLPLFPGMTAAEQDEVVQGLESLHRRFGR
ncbi:MAG: DegT/DnrJ/EryC1/StrS family aminotransferase [Myxococcaceae bacterium]|nr:DegT/DnrJ/EryC1/StrS family aminotransferase [Myxococcaceae bacterium]